ncbi:histidine protein kinase NIK1 [Podospora aff. communis PSN243]|uniref:histidine kinase n=1 Tax=Podospora aff. communis PSN243 TaxID=3040156 RepID=A0AAV9GXW2_9PEZI|nr:histidine protein kinase NIK1 [Podospora aff. communis PSN243]
MSPGDSPPAQDDAPTPFTSASMSSPVLKPAASNLQDGTTPRSPANRLVRDAPSSLPPDLRRSQSASPFRLPTPYITPGQVAFSALQFLPMPLLVLGGSKTVIMANEAMGRLLSDSGGEVDDKIPITDRLRHRSLSQIGIDLTQGGTPVLVDWGQFLDQVAVEMGIGRTKEDPGCLSSGEGNPAPTLTDDTGAPRSNAVVEVVISHGGLDGPYFTSNLQSKAVTLQVHAKMIISVWEISENQTFFTLTFTSTDTAPSVSPAPGKKSVADLETLRAAEEHSVPTFNKPPSLASNYDSCCFSFINPSSFSLSSSPFPPLGPPAKSSVSSAPSILQKLILLKDALLDNSSTPILAMWKDGSAAFANRAARDLLNPNACLESAADGFDLLPAWALYTDDFSRRLEPREYPISVVIETETPFTGFRIGMYDKTGKNLVFDAEGTALRDPNTGEFLAGVITCRDVTEVAAEISRIKATEEEHFRLMCDTMPQLVWTTTPDGLHDFFNSRWYNYTGLTPQTSLGMGWMNPFHPEDLAESERRWKHSLATGEPYMTEYRCRSKEGEWRWFLGRALPLKNKTTGKIEKWFGTCTDVHEGIESKLEARRARRQLLSVIALSDMTVFTIDVNRKVTMLEGALIWNLAGSDNTCDSHWYIGQDIYHVFNRLSSQPANATQRAPFLEPLELILSGKATAEYKEHELDGRWYRTRFQPIVGKRKGSKGLEEDLIDGVTGIVMDVTELKVREKHIQTQAQEKRRLVANEAAAKEASRLKSQFLANMSHEIRTPISEVIGMAQLLLDDDEGEDRREITQTIFRSANALLSVINDILDFSKVESGRLDIEDVQFSLSMDVVQEVSKMLQFAAKRKQLDFKFEIGPDIDNNLMLMGDPGRVRQILTNLLTNSIKFTNRGHVRFSVTKEMETQELIQIKFLVEDTGIGIGDHVRKKLFQPFSQGDPSTARRFGGTGLGLTISKNLLDLMRGRMTMESTLGKGTTTTFWIPFNKPRLPQASGPTQPLPESCNSSDYEPNPLVPPSAELLDKGGSAPRYPSPSLSGASSPEEELSVPERAKFLVLVVEDNAIIQKYATKTIKKLGFQVKAVWNGKKALEYIEAAQAGEERKPDIILMDVQMPVIDGYKCTHILRCHSPYKLYMNEIPIVALTASAIQGDEEKCKKAGMDDYLSKPVEGKILEQMLVRWITRSRPAHSPTEISIPSDCSESGVGCDKVDIPGMVDHDTALSPDALPSKWSDEFSDAYDQITPRPTAKTRTEESMVTPKPNPVQSEFYCPTDGAANGSVIVGGDASTSQVTTSPMPLTEENIGRLDHESQQY